MNKEDNEQYDPKKVIEAVNKLNEMAKANGISDMTLEEINEEIRQYRKEKHLIKTEDQSDDRTIDETHGVLTLDEIKESVEEVLSEYPIDFVILFGSYARGEAIGRSDVDLLISTSVTGMKFFGIVERLRVKLKKKVDLLDLKQLNNNEKLLSNVLREGVRIYVQD